MLGLNRIIILKILKILTCFPTTTWVSLQLASNSENSENPHLLRHHTWVSLQLASNPENPENPENPQPPTPQQAIRVLENEILKILKILNPNTSFRR